MTRTEINGDERPIEFRAPGRILGAAAVFSGNPALMTATALSRCEVYYLPVASFRRLAVSNPALAEYLLGTL
ncbi:MAG TPA: cyclic nucleotide-binding domain-containing protein, partial [Blastocatellia bacterium]|nr:cyclic nucleotide-binding domain-containing protein [Blastocatellia bacterium]